MLFAIAALPFCIPTNSVLRFQLLHIVANTFSVPGFFFFIVAILMGVRQHLISILIFIPLWLVLVSLFISSMVSNRELLFSYAYWASLFLCSLAICTSSLEKCWSPLTNFSIGLFVLLGSKNSLYILDINSLSAIWLANACPIPWVSFSLCLLCPLMHKSF